MRIYVHALGGGHGHLIRARGLAGGLNARGHDVVVGVPADHPHRAALEDLPFELWPLSPSELGEEFRRRAECFELFVVDALPGGVLGELEGWRPPGRFVLLERILSAPAPRERFDGVLELEPEGGTGVVEPSTAPAPAPVILVGGDDGLDGLFDRLGRALEARGVPHARLGRRGLGAGDPSEASLEPVPLGGAACVVGAAGYHLVHEARALGVPHFALPRRRRFDDQRRRAERFGCILARSPEALLEGVTRAARGALTRTAVAARDYDQLAEELLGQDTSPS